MKEALALLVLIALAVTAIVELPRVVSSHRAASPYDTFPGRVNRIPLSVITPTAGQVLKMPPGEGSHVDRNSELAVIQVFDRTFRPPADSQMFKLQGDRLALVSPVDGVVGRMSVAPLSAVGGNASLMDLYTIQGTDLQVLVPASTGIRPYRQFFAAAHTGGTRVPIDILGLLPRDPSAGGTTSTMAYRATCHEPGDCAPFLSLGQVVVFALKGPSAPGGG